MAAPPESLVPFIKVKPVIFIVDEVTLNILDCPCASNITSPEVQLTIFNDLVMFKLIFSPIPLYIPGAMKIVSPSPRFLFSITSFKVLYGLFEEPLPLSTTVPLTYQFNLLLADNMLFSSILFKFTPTSAFSDERYISTFSQETIFFE